MGCLGYKFIRHERNQSKTISLLSESVEELNLENKNLSEQIDKINSELQKIKKTSVNWSKKTYNYLAIGNSLTVHGKCDYWWNEVGMAATTEENDFVHQLSAKIEKAQDKPVLEYAYNFSAWEVNAHDRSEYLPTLDEYLSDQLDLVTIQLGENASNWDTLEKDLEELIKYVKEAAPNAKIIVVGDFWDTGERGQLRLQAAQNCSVEFVSLDEIANKPEYQCGLGTTVYDENGETHIVEHEGVAGHPGDAGMRWIAERIFEKLTF